MIKKLVLPLIAVFLFAYVGPTYASAITQETSTDEVLFFDTESLEKDEIIKELQSELSFENIQLNVKEITKDDLSVEAEINQEDVNAQVNVQMDVETESFKMTSEIEDDNGSVLSQNFNVTIQEVTEDYLVATFEDVETGEVMEMDSRQVQASPIPVAVYVVGAAIIRTTAVLVKGVKTLKIGGKTFKKQAPSVATNATKKFKTVAYKTGSKSFNLSKGNMNHILRGHHPKYWTGEDKSMFDPKLSINDIKGIVDKIVKAKSKSIESGLKSKKKEAVVTHKIDGVNYKLIVKKDYVASLYPVK
ncbi:hypothetical protein CEW92_03450 [Bacillaceae bacterium SAS-127]|nr:hypothetical protein CEW92_03450 [Bacillaceae bacterium SAS-127]